MKHLPRVCNLQLKDYDDWKLPVENHLRFDAFMQRLGGKR